MSHGGWPEEKVEDGILGEGWRGELAVEFAHEVFNFSDEAGESAGGVVAGAAGAGRAREVELDGLLEFGADGFDCVAGVEGELLGGGGELIEGGFERGGVAVEGDGGGFGGEVGDLFLGGGRVGVGGDGGFFAVVVEDRGESVFGGFGVFYIQCFKNELGALVADDAVNLVLERIHGLKALGLQEELGLFC